MYFKLNQTSDYATAVLKLCPNHYKLRLKFIIQNQMVKLCINDQVDLIARHMKGVEVGGMGNKV